MFKFPWKKSGTTTPEVRALADRVLGPIAMVSAMADVATDHAKRIQSKEVPYPVLDAKGVPMVRRWHHFRLEACLRGIRYGRGSLFELAELQNQQELLSELLDKKAHLSFPQPAGGVLAQSIQGMWQVYLCLSEEGSKLADSKTDRFVLSAAHKTILSDLEDAAVKAQQWWQSCDQQAGPRADMPPMLFELFFNDLNRKTKSIVLSKFFGPRGLLEAPAVIEEVRKTQGDEMAGEMRQLIEILDSADNPDQAIERAANLSIAGYL